MDLRQKGEVRWASGPGEWRVQSPAVGGSLVSVAGEWREGLHDADEAGPLG